MAKIDAFFKLMGDLGASDLACGGWFAADTEDSRRYGRVVKLFDDDELTSMLYEIASEDKIKVFEETGDVDLPEIPGLARYALTFSR
jgi:twitching motility protein PilT